MTNLELALGILAAASLGAFVLVFILLKEFERELSRLDKRQSEHWREHKDDHYEDRHRHAKLMDALDMIEVPAQNAHYAKKGNV